MHGSTLILGGILAVSVLAATVEKTSNELIQEHRIAARQALAAKDYATYRENLLALGPLLNDQADLTYALGAADALLGHPDSALKHLKEFAATGLTRDAAGDPRFQSLLKVPEFQAVAQRLLANGKPISKGRVVFTLHDPDLIAEDIAYDPGSHQFFVSSVHEHKVVAINQEGTTVDLPALNAEGWAVFALSFDSKHHLLWATVAAVPESLGFNKADAGKTALLEYDLAAHKLIQRFDLKTDGGPHALGDMTISPAGDVYVSDGYGQVYMLPSGGKALEPISQPGAFRSPQTPALTPDGKRLLVADYSLGVGVIDLKTKALAWMPRSKNIALEGTDGLYLRGANLIAIQNGVAPARIVRVMLSPDLGRATDFSTLEQSTPSLGDPTHGVFVGDSFYFIGNSGWNRMSDDGKLTPGAPNDCPVVMEMKISPTI